MKGSEDSYRLRGAPGVNVRTSEWAALRLGEADATFRVRPLGVYPDVDFSSATRGRSAGRGSSSVDVIG